LLKSFTKKELEGLQYFTENPYFNTDKDLSALIKPLKKYALSKERFTTDIQLKVYQAVFKDGSGKQKELSKKQKDYLTNKLNALLRLAEQFLMVDAMKDKEQYKFELLYPKLIDKRQTLLFNRHFKRDSKKLDAEKKRGVDYHNMQFKLQSAKLDFYFKEGLITKEDNYEELQYYLDVNYLAEKLKYHLAQVNLRKNFANKEYDFSSFEMIQPLLSYPKYASIPVVKIYLLVIDLVVKQDDYTFHTLLEILIDENATFPKNCLKPFYTILSNYCILQIGSGKLEFHQYLWNVYQQMHVQDLLQKDGFIDLQLLKNVITSSCSVQKLNWALEVIEHYKPYIPQAVRNSAYYYNLGIISFNQCLFDKAHSYFIRVQKIDDAHDIDTRMLLLKCIYEKEQDYSDATIQSFNSAKIFFKRKTSLTESNRKAYINFVTILIEIYKYKLQENNKRLIDIEKKLNYMRHIYYKVWLLCKLEELKDKS